MSLLHRIFRYIINAVCLTTSISLTIYFFSSLSDNKVFQVAIIPIVITLESLAQYLLSFARWNWSNKRRIKACILFLVYGQYLLVFALFSGLSFFVAEIDTRETIASRVVFAETKAQEKYNQNTALIDTLNRQLLTEAETGFGTRSKGIMEEIDKLKQEQKELLEKFQKSIIPEAVTNVFTAMGKVLHMSADLLKIIVFATVILLIYVGLVVTSWNLKFTVSNEAENATDQNLDTCPICGKTFPPKTNKIYCSPKCRLTAFRINKEADLQEVK